MEPLDYNGRSSVPSQNCPWRLHSRCMLCRGSLPSTKTPCEQFVNYFTAHNELLQSKLLQIPEQEFKEIIISIIQIVVNEEAALTYWCSTLCL